jgi:hypothetical protein
MNAKLHTRTFYDAAKGIEMRLFFDFSSKKAVMNLPAVSRKPAPSVFFSFYCAIFAVELKNGRDSPKNVIPFKN